MSKAAILLMMALLQGCTSLFFYPQRQHVLKPNQVGLAYRDIYFQSTDDVALHGWWLPAQGRALGTVLFLHGNAENISTHLGSVYWLPAQRFNVFLLDYRGYGASTGTPSVPGLIEDAEGALRELIHRPDIDTRCIVVFGQSLGGAVATYAIAHSAYRANVRAVILDSTFSSFRLIAREKLASFWLTWPLQWPLSFAFDDTYSPVEAIPALSPIPVLIIHGEQDEIVPKIHAQRLYQAAKEPKALWLMPGAGHIQSLAHPENRERFVRYLRKVLGGQCG
jgi:fermentation-respiration switch protein FrsA (DUF1100 family)